MLAAWGYRGGYEEIILVISSIGLRKPAEKKHRYLRKSGAAELINPLTETVNQRKRKRKEK
jgi:hypothetical protein